MGRLIAAILIFVLVGCTHVQYHKFEPPITTPTKVSNIQDKNININVRLVLCGYEDLDTAYVIAAWHSLKLAEFYFDELNLRFIPTQIERYEGYEINDVCATYYDFYNLTIDSGHHPNYLNVYIVPSGPSKLLGEAMIPQSGYSTIAIYGAAVMSPDVIAHEIAHWAGLSHAWENDPEVKDVDPVTNKGIMSLNLMGYGWAPEKISLGDRYFSHDQLIKMKKTLEKYHQRRIVEHEELQCDFFTGKFK